MTKIILIPDSFKGSLTQFEFIDIAKEVILGQDKHAKIVELPIADGGEGTVDCFLSAIKGKRRPLEVTFSNFDKREGYWGDFKDFAVMEVATACGLANTKNKNPLITTTYGVGEIIKDIIDRGIKDIIIGLGGSSTNDMGAGMAAALGVKFYNKAGEEFIPCGGTLNEVVEIDLKQANALLDGVNITAMCDVNNTLYGENGAANVYARQKGANDIELLILDSNIKHLIGLIDNGEEIASTPGAGAAGGLGAGVMAFLKGSLKSGIETLLDLVDFDDKIKNADFIITGEGKLDEQSIQGKVINGIIERAKKADKKIDIFCGRNDLLLKTPEELNINNIIEITPRGVEINTALENAKKYLKRSLESFFHTRI